MIAVFGKLSFKHLLIHVIVAVIAEGDAVQCIQMIRKIFLILHIGHIGGIEHTHCRKDLLCDFLSGFFKGAVVMEMIQTGKAPEIILRFSAKHGRLFLHDRDRSVA